MEGGRPARRAFFRLSYSSVYRFTNLEAWSAGGHQDMIDNMKHGLVDLALNGILLEGACVVVPHDLLEKLCSLN